MVAEGESSAAASTAAGALKKGPWAAAEDAVLMEYVKKHGEGNWNAVQRNTGLQRCGKSCRLRWANHLRPNLKKGAFSPDEERLIIDLHSKLGNKWARISAHLPGRTDNEIKNYWNTRVKRRLRQGLPLYPNQNNSVPSQNSKMPPIQPPTLPFSFQKNPTNNNITTNSMSSNNTLSLFNQGALSSPLFTLHHPPPFFPPHSLKRCSNSYLGRPAPAQMSSFQMGSVGVGVGVGFGFDLGQVPSTRNVNEGFGFDFPNSFELPSNQLNQNVANDPVVVDEVKVTNNNNSDNLNVVRTKSGLLDDLLQEAQVKGGGGRGLKRERDQDCGILWDISTSENSSTGIKKAKSEEQQMNFGNDDLSNILDLIPSPVQVPGWCHEEGVESPVGQSSVISTDDNYKGVVDRMPEPASLPVGSTADYEDDGGDWNPGCYGWDILPSFC